MAPLRSILEYPITDNIENLKKQLPLNVPAEARDSMQIGMAMFPAIVRTL